MDSNIHPSDPTTLQPYNPTTDHKDDTRIHINFVAPFVLNVDSRTRNNRSKLNDINYRRCTCCPYADSFHLECAHGVVARKNYGCVGEGGKGRILLSLLPLVHGGRTLRLV